MAELTVDQTEIGLLMMGLDSIEDALLNEDWKVARARLAYKLGAAHAGLLRQPAEGGPRG